MKWKTAVWLGAYITFALPAGVVVIGTITITALGLAIVHNPLALLGFPAMFVEIVLALKAGAWFLERL